MKKKYLEILKKIKPPNVKNLIRNVFNNGEHDCYNNNAHNSVSADFSEIEEFCKMLYIDWRNFLIAHKDKFTEERHIKAIEKLETNPMYFPENIEKIAGTPFYKFIYSGYNKAFGYNTLRFAELQDNKDMKDMKDVGFDNDAFMHVFGWKINGTEHKEENARIYVNLIAKNIPMFVKEFYKHCMKVECPFYFKFDKKDNRNDPFLIYTSYDNLENFLLILNQMKQEVPELFEGTNNISNNLGVLYDNFGYADEPKSEFNDSANGIRKKILLELREECFQKVTERIRKTPLSNVSIINKTLLTYEELRDKIAREYVTEYMQQEKEFFKDKPKKLVDIHIKQLATRIDAALLTGERQVNFISYNNYPFREPLNYLKKFEEAFSGERNFSKEIVLRGSLAKHRYFSYPLNDEEKNLNNIVFKYLKLGCNAELMNGNPETQEIAQRVLKELDEKSEIGKSLTLLGTANFLKNKSLNVTLTNGKRLEFSEYNYDIIAELIGEDEINKIFEEKCKKYGIASKNFAFNQDTWEEVSRIQNDEER